ncbi:MAG: protoglobin domain-containing protein [Thermaceae bacterium]
MPTDKSLGEFYQKAQAIFDQLPPEARFRFEDGKTIAQHRDFLLSLGGGIVKGFYNTLFAHPTTRRIFREGERPRLEKTLAHWWRRTVEGPFNAQYFAWQTLVGLVHLSRGVTSAMMTSMWGFIVDYVAERAKEALGEEEARRLEKAIRRLGITVTALIGEGYLQAHLEALSQKLEKSLEDLIAIARGETEELLRKMRSA